MRLVQVDLEEEVLAWIKERGLDPEEFTRHAVRQAIQRAQDRERVT